VEYTAALVGFGLPDTLAGLLADCAVGASRGDLFDDSRELNGLIGRPTTPLAASISAAPAAAAIASHTGVPVAS
jgi:NAD(P)H dehydrogenase (quinone)